MSENVFDKAKISDEEWSRLQISRLSSRPNAKTAYGSGGYDANAMKAAFDAQGNMLKERHNLLTDYARREETARAAAETARAAAEQERDEAENGYTDINGDFVFGRVQNEEARISAEGKRQEYYKDVNTIVGIIKDTQNAIIEGGGDAIISFIHPYPVGSIYISINETDPGTLFGGTWERLKDRFLLGAGDTYLAGATGGSATHTIEDVNMPGGTGWVAQNKTAGKYVSGTTYKSYAATANEYILTTREKANEFASTPLTSNAPINHMPPYLTVYMWKRIA